MARTAITVTDADTFARGVDPTATAGDAANDHSLVVGRTPVLLVCQNTNAATVDFSLELPASDMTGQLATSIDHTIPAAAAGIDGIRTLWIDVPGVLLESGGALYIDSADANFGDVRFYAVRGIKTRG